MALLTRLRTQDEKDPSGLPGLMTLAVAVGFLGAGVLGMLLTGFDPDRERFVLWVFRVNLLHNVVHLLFGLLGLAWWRSLTNARLYGLVLLAGYGVVLLWGLIFVNYDNTEPNALALNSGDNVLHLALVVAGALIWRWQVPGSNEARREAEDTYRPQR
jgi:ABC-type transport system involved in multi-copper enzyme maturation permease subunit